MKIKISLILSLFYVFLFSLPIFALEIYDHVSIKVKEYPSTGESVILEAVTPTQTKSGSSTYVYFNHGPTPSFGSSTVPVLVSALATTSNTLSVYQLEIKGIVPGQYYYARAVRMVASTSSNANQYAFSGTESIFIAPKKTAPVMQGVTSRNGLCTAEDCELKVYENSPVFYDLGTVNASVSSYFYQTKNFKFDSGNTDEVFGIDFSGKILLAKSGVLDVDKKDRYEIVVRAFDPSNTNLYSTRKITIKVLPKEDNPAGSGSLYGVNTPGGYGTSTYQGSYVNYYDPIVPGGYTVSSRSNSNNTYKAFKNEPGGYDAVKRGSTVYASYHTVTPGGYGFSSSSTGGLNLTGKSREEAILEISKKLLELQIEYIRVKALEDKGKTNVSY